MGSHSLLPPSGAPIWGSPNGCTGWVLMSQMYPETEETPEAAEGTASHEVGAKLIQAATVAAGFIDLPIGQPASNGVVITEEMFEAAEVYAEDVADVMRSTGNFVPQVEQRVNCPTIHELSWGTPDCWIYDKATGNLYIWDYKFGYGVVEAFENWQLINYLAGIIEQLELTGIQTQYITVHMRIVQPRAFHHDGVVREWIVNASDLRGYFNTLEAAAAETLGSNPVTRSGSHCKHCPGRHACSAALQAGVQLYEVAAQPMALELPVEALSVQLSIVKRAIKQLECIESGMSEQAKVTIKTGNNVPGWLLEQGQGRQKWSVPIDEVVAMGAIEGVVLSKDAVITPKQAIKLGIDAGVISQYSITPNTGLKLVPDNGNKARRLFS
jgi:hypothetical protein